MVQRFVRCGPSRPPVEQNPGRKPVENFEKGRVPSFKGHHGNTSVQDFRKRGPKATQKGSNGCIPGKGHLPTGTRPGPNPRETVGCQEIHGPKEATL